MADKNDGSRYVARRQQANKQKATAKKRRSQQAQQRARGESPGRARAAATAPMREADHRGAKGRVGLGVPTRGVLSVIMSAYRSTKWLGAAVKSVLNQNLPWGWRLELLIGVDACPETLKAALAFKDERVVVVEMEKNVGTYQTLNTLLGYARGALVAVMDSDDVSRPGRMSAGIAALVEDPTLGVVAGYYRNCDEGLEPTEAPTKRICHGAMMVRRALYKKLGGYKPWRCGADWDFLARVEKTRYGVILQAQAFLLRRVHSKSLCQSEATGPNSDARRKAFAEIENEKERPSPTVVRATPVPHRVVRDHRPLFASGIGVVMPTVPQREETAKAVLDSLLAQGVDAIHLHLNGHGAVPQWARRERVRAILHPVGTGPLVRFAELPDCEFILSVDDDIVYPSDYVQKTVAQLKSHGRGVALSYHGTWWPQGTSPAYRDREGLPYTQPSSRSRAIQYGGSGVAAFHGHDLWLLEADLAPRRYEMEDDVWISSAVARTGMTYLRPPSSESWIRATPAGGTGLYTKATANGFRRRDAAIVHAMRLGVWSPGQTRAAQAARPAARKSWEQDFWKKRYRETGSSILTVGRRDASVAKNEDEYRAAIEQFKRMVRADFPDPRLISVLDVGYGHAHYAQALAELGVRDYTGIDFASQVAPQKLLARGFKFHKGVDASSPTFDLGRTFDLVIVIDVMFHIVEDARFDQATANLNRHAARLVYVTGLFEDRQLAPHVRHRKAARFGFGKPVSLEAWRDNKIARFQIRDKKK